VVLRPPDRGPESAYFQIFVPFAGDGTPHPWRGVRTDRFMYAQTEAGPWVLYDLRDDPYEMKDLAHDPAQTAVRDELDAKLAAWMKRTGDSWANNSMAPVEDKGRLYRFETFTTIREYLDWEARHPELAPKD
jgi:arylsulfatase A-like enzyme